MGWSYRNYSKICITFLTLSTFKITLDDIISHIISYVYIAQILAGHLCMGMDIQLVFTELSGYLYSGFYLGNLGIKR